MEISRNQDVGEMLKKIRCFALDMDGTFYLGGRLLPGSLEFIHRLRLTGRAFVFVTNNSSRSGQEYVDKLARMGLAVAPGQLATSGQATADLLMREFPGKRVFLLGNQTLKDEFVQRGVCLDDRDPQLVVTAYDTTLDYEKLCRVCDCVRAGLPYIATHPDFNCPTESGFAPDIGAVHAYIQASTGRAPDRIVGKPYRTILDYALAQVGCEAAETAMVGDRLYTDIAATEHLPGLTGILVLSGETRLSDLRESNRRPDLVFDSLAQITPLL